MSRGAAAALGLALTSALAACGTATLDEAELEADIAGALQRQVGEKPKLECPAGEVVERGRRFRCALTARDGSRGQVEVTLRDAEGGFTYRVLAPEG